MSTSRTAKRPKHPKNQGTGARWTLAVLGPKGGIGKSTIATSLVAEAMVRGRSVVLVDADTNAVSQMWAAKARSDGHPAPTVVTVGPALGKPGELTRMVGAYDLVIIDCPGGLDDEAQREALMLCDLALLPCSPSIVDGWVLNSKAKPLIERARGARPSLRAAIVITRKKERTALGETAREEMAAASGLPVLETTLGDRLDYQRALGSGQGATTYAPRSAAAVEVRALYDEIFNSGRKP